jgi:hypothetical protein
MKRTVTEPTGDVHTDEMTNTTGEKAVPVSLAPLGMETALRALLATKPANRRENLAPPVVEKPKRQTTKRRKNAPNRSPK